MRECSAPSFRASGLASALFGLALLLLACAAVAQPPPGRPQGLPVRAGLEQNPPLSFMTPQGDAAGVLVDIFEEVARQEGWRIEYVPDTLERCLEKLGRGDLDLMITLARSPERAALYDFNRVSVIANWGEVYTRPGAQFGSYFDLRGKRIAVVRGDIHQQYFRTLLESFGIAAEFIPVDDFSRVFGMLQEGEADAGVVGRFFALQNEGKYTVNATALVFNPIQVHYAAPRGARPEILAAIDRHLERLKADPRSVYYRSLDRWLGVTGGRGLPRWLQLTLGAVAGAIVLLIGAVFLFRTQLRLRTRHLERVLADRLHAEDRLAYQANYDPLTGLPNRTLFGDRVGQAMTRDEFFSAGLAVILLDLDNFKLINETLGHTAGDVLLRQVAARIGSRLRKTDTLARLGGDEFAILAPDLPEPRLAGEIAQHVIEGLSEAFVVGGGPIYVTASLGIATYPQDADTLEALLQHADAAMYHAKGRGKNTFQFFVADLNQRVHDRLEMETLLRRALDRGEFFLQYQPQVELAGGRIVGVEALLRWQPHGAMTVMPDIFIPVLEETGLIVPVGEWALREACRQVRQWHRDGYPALRLSVNICARQFQQGAVEDRVPAILSEVGLEPRHLCLEVTESMLMHDSEEMLHRLARLRAAGVELSIDDFGTGYSSLRYLKSMPLTELKIDRSFIASVPAGDRDAAIVVSVIQIAKQLGLSVVAEGVETAGQLRFLTENGCHGAQGYLLGEPLAAEAVADFLAAAEKGPDLAD